MQITIDSSTILPMVLVGAKMSHWPRVHEMNLKEHVYTEAGLNFDNLMSNLFKCSSIHFLR